MDGFSFERAHLAPSAKPSGSGASILRKAIAVQRAAYSFDVLHVIGELASTLCLPTLALRPSVVSPQGLSLLRRVGGVRKHAASVNLRAVVSAASRTICAAETEYADVLDAVGRHAAHHVRVIHNGVALANPVSPERRAALRAELGIATSEMVGAWIGTLDEQKDPLCAIRAVHSVRREGIPITLLVAGDGPLRSEAERAARETDAVQVLGFRRDVERILGASDFFVLSSRREGLSFSLLEAMALGVAPVVSDAPANVEAVGTAGIVVPFGDSSSFADAFRRLRSAEERAALGEQARERVARHFSVEEMIRRTRDVYDLVARARRAR
jgi:glycosyltransferase involved in cell wall biosynthesis